MVQIKLLEALVQEFAVRLDQHLINEILDLFPKERIETTYNVIFDYIILQYDFDIYYMNTFRKSPSIRIWN